MMLAGAVAAVIGLFLPLVEVKHGPIVIGFTAVDLSFGMERTRALLDKQLPSIADKRLPRDIRSAREDARTVSDASRGAALAFVPGIAMGLLAAIGFLRKRFGRILGFGGFVLGVGSVGAWLGLRYVIQYALEELELQKTQVHLQLGGHMLLVAGGLGLLAGLGAIVQPDRG